MVKNSSAWWRMQQSICATWRQRWALFFLVLPGIDLEWIDFAVKHFSNLYSDVTYSEIESIFLLAYINTWGFHVPGPDPESKGVITGTGLYYVGSMFNHSCNPNSAFLSTCLNNQKVLIAMKDIRQGEEVTCAYINCQQAREARQNELKFGWNFDCTCQR